ncbi:MAG: type II secretion system major pseudopilin GspG [Deltaproteobacteria bacterium]|nr:type II secretion system major pseudopilin GspG [Deltaproteobacteria bacterium]
MSFRGVAKVLRSQAGMTLIEIMVVVAIIGSIAALVTVNVLSYLDESKVETTKIQMKNVEGALDQYKRRHGSYPTTEQGLSALVEKPTVGKVPDNYPPDGYLKAVPKDGWGNDFIYASPGSAGHKIEIVSYGGDGQEGGEGFDADITNYEVKEEAKTE